MRLMVTAAMVLASLVGSAGAASADKPVRGCPDGGFTFYTEAQLTQMFPNAPAGLFARYDKNRDGLLCGKQTGGGDPTRGIFNTVDNTANRP